MTNTVLVKHTVKDIKTIAEAEAIAAQKRLEGYRAGVSGQSAPDGSYTGLYCVTCTVNRKK